jgi:DNA-binding transcriptional MerR regulator
VLGPKIGFGFFSNLTGNFEPVTMDMWFMRTIGRLIGKLKSFDAKKFDKQTNDFMAALDDTGSDGLYAADFDPAMVAAAREQVEDEDGNMGFNESAIVDLAREVDRRHQRDFVNNRAGFDAKTRIKTPLVFAAGNIVKSMDKPKDAPASGGERRLMRAVVKEAVRILHKQLGTRVPAASLQALIWYPEQELYRSLGTRLTVTSQDYAGAALKVLKEEGIDEATILAAGELGSGQARQDDGGHDTGGAQADGEGPGRADALQGKERQQFLDARYERTQLEKEAVDPKRVRVIFEVAPDPNDAKLTSTWNSLASAAKLSISKAVARVIVPKVLAAYNMKALSATQIGSYQEFTNPSFALMLEKSGSALQISKEIGFVLNQDSMMLLAPKEFKGGDSVGAIRIDIGVMNEGKVDEIYQKLREIRVNGEQVVGGQSTINGQMTVLNYSDVATDELGRLIDEKLAGAYPVGGADVYSAFPEKKDYDYGLPSNDPRGNAGLARQRARALRAEASRLLAREIRSAQAAQRSSPGAEASSEDLTLRKSVKAATEAIKEYASDFGDGMFRTPKTDAKEMPQIIKDIGGQYGIKLQAVNSKIDTRADKMYVLNISGEKDGVRYSRDSYIGVKRDAVWVNVGSMTSGMAGGAIYQIAGAYAKNNGKTFIGDPDGISEAGKRRRLENMISLALKYGTTDFMRPHEDMLHGWGGLMWSNNSDHNLMHLLNASSRVTSKLVPEIKEIRFDPRTGRFTHDGADFGRADFQRLAERSREAAPVTDRAGMPGSGTLRFAVIFKSLALGPQQAAQGRSDGSLGDGDVSPDLLRSNLTNSLGDLRSSQKQDPWYSALERRLGTVDMKAGPAQGWNGVIKGLVAKGDVKADEVEWSGINDWLALQQGKVTKDQVLQFLAGNGVKLEETVHGAGSLHKEFSSFGSARDFLREYHDQTKAEFNADYGDFSDQEVIDTANDLFAETYPDSAAQTKYHSYTLPGGTNYREVLLTLPPKVNSNDEWRAAVAQKHARSIAESAAALRYAEEKFGPFSDEAAEAQEIARQARVARDADLTEAARTKFKASAEKVNYLSGHWDQPNILAHIRVNDRTDADGKRVLFVEEIQSDWAQEGKKKGITGDLIPQNTEWQAVDTLERTASRAAAETWIRRNPPPNPGENMEARLVIREINRGTFDVLEEQRSTVSQAPNRGGVPRAPFIDKTDKWVALALKRVIKMAVDEGYDKVAFVTGDQSADRYDLSSQVNYIQWNPGFSSDLNVMRTLVQLETSGGNTIGFEVNTPAGGKGVIAEGDFEGKTLEDVLGKEIAQKINQDDSGDLRGLDLKVGGEGMKAFYDKIVPAVAKDVLRKLGGGRMESVDLADQRTSAFTGEPTGEYDITHEGQPGFDITPAMREKAADGLPMFSRKQTDNSGAFDPTNPDIRFSHQQQPVPEETRYEASRRVIQDQHLRMQKIRTWALENGAQLSLASDVYGAEERMHGRTATRIEDFREKTFKPLIERAQRAGFSLDDIAQVLHAQHADERNQQVARINPQMPDGGSGMDTADAQQILAAASPQLKAIAAQFQAITTRAKDILLRGGIITPEQSAAWSAAYQHYVPLKGGDDAEASKTGTGKGLSVNGKTKRAMGHTLREEHILENIMRDYERAVMLVEKNRVGQTMMLWLTEMADPRIGTVDQPVKRAMLVNSKQYDVRAQNPALSVATFDTRADAEKFIRDQIRVRSPGAHRLVIREMVGDPMVQYRARPMLEEHEAQVYVNGHAVRMQINDPLLAQSYKRLNSDQMGKLIQISRNINTFLSRAYTGYNPAFIPRNLIRDFGSGVIKLTGNFGVKTTAGVLAKYPKALASLLRYSFSGTSTPLIDQYRASGGSTGAAYLGDLERIGTDIQKQYEEYVGVKALAMQGRYKASARVAAGKVIGGLAGWIERLNGATENAMRLAAFEQVLQETGSVDQAASAGKNSTLNFNRKGEMGGTLGALYLFFNPNVQDTASIIDMFTKGKHKGQAMALVWGMLASAYSLAALQFGGGDDDYQRWLKISNNVKDRNLILRTGEDTYITIPVPFGFGIFHSLGNAMFDLQRGSSINELSVSIANSLLSNFSPVGNPLEGAKTWGTADPKGLVELIPGYAGGELFRDAARIVANRSSFGSPIVPDSKFDEGRPDFLRLNRSTKGSSYDMLARGMSDLTGGTATQSGAVDISPETLKFWASALTGGTGTFLSDLTHLAGLGVRAGMSNPDNDALAPERHEIPILRDYTKQERVTDSRRAFWDASNEAKAALLDFQRAAKAGDEDGMNKVSADNEELLALARGAKGYQKQIKSLRDRVDEINGDKTLSLAYQRGAVKQLERDEAEVYDQFLRSVTLGRAEALKRKAGL